MKFPIIKASCFANYSWASFSSCSCIGFFTCLVFIFWRIYYGAYSNFQSPIFQVELSICWVSADSASSSNNTSSKCSISACEMVIGLTHNAEIPYKHRRFWSNKTNYHQEFPPTFYQTGGNPSAPGHHFLDIIYAQ